MSFAAHEMPVDCGRILQGGYNAGPLTRTCMSRHGVGLAATVDIAVGHVHAAEVSHGAVDYAELAVVAPVDARAELRERHLEERIGLYTALPQFFKKRDRTWKEPTWGRI